jgi:hypothetical protein
MANDLAAFYYYNDAVNNTTAYSNTAFDEIKAGLIQEITVLSAKEGGGLDQQLKSANTPEELLTAIRDAISASSGDQSSGAGLSPSVGAISSVLRTARKKYMISVKKQDDTLRNNLNIEDGVASFSMAMKDDSVVPMNALGVIDLALEDLGFTNKNLLNWSPKEIDDAVDLFNSRAPMTPFKGSFAPERQEPLYTVDSDGGRINISLVQEYPWRMNIGEVNRVVQYHADIAASLPDAKNLNRRTIEKAVKMNLDSGAGDEMYRSYIEHSVTKFINEYNMSQRSKETKSGAQYSEQAKANELVSKLVAGE